MTALLPGEKLAALIAEGNEDDKDKDGGFDHLTVSAAEIQHRHDLTQESHGKSPDNG